MYTLGIDYGTNSVRALLVRCKDGKETGTGIYNYQRGQQGVLLDPKDHLLARQSPYDYVEGLEQSVKLAVEDARASHPDFDPSQVVGIGVDTTGSSPIPVDASNTPLAFQPDFKGNLNAQCWLWKDHTSHAEAAAITDLGRRERPRMLAQSGNVYSSEWWWSKIWHCLKVDPAVFQAAHSWVELADWVPALLCGINRPKDVKRCACAAGHKALFDQSWGGLPDKEFLTQLAPELAQLRDRLYGEVFDISFPAGQLCPEWAERLGIPAGIPVAMGEFDVHYGAVGCGIQEGTLVKVIGTSSCDCAVLPAENEAPVIQGICGIARGSILPGYFGVEAGQSAVGDLFKWWVEGVCEGEGGLHADLTREIQELPPGATGLLALDWNNGNRTILVDQRLTGLILGQTLHTSRAEIYRALIEASAFGARAILERLDSGGVHSERIVCAGGIAGKNAFLMHTYADITGREMAVSSSNQTCALGAAVAAAVLAGPENGGHATLAEACDTMTSLGDTVYRPDPERHQTYNQLYKLYLQVHDAFGGVNPSADLSRVMKDLLDLKDSTHSVS
ncbi:MAG: ribulokinase [Verrucomicrobia bacterium]|nr:ribulokinase [Verrucomicrobiota bacterium]MCH8525708.1 ribulokinase [Kiritimatiellia bacterium]